MLDFRILNPKKLDDVKKLQGILEKAPLYSLLVKGHPPLPSDTKEMVKECPPAKTLKDKVVGGFLLGKALARIYAIANSWDCRTLRFAVIETNHIAFKFWKQEGFKELHRRPVAGCIGMQL